jgi:hypothetical protein
MNTREVSFLGEVITIGDESPLAPSLKEMLKTVKRIGAFEGCFY